MGELFELKPSKHCLILVIFTYMVTVLVVMLYAPIAWALLLVAVLGFLGVKQVFKLRDPTEKITAFRLTQDKLTLYYQAGKTITQIPKKPIFQSRYLIILPIEKTAKYFTFFVNENSLVIFSDGLIQKQSDKTNQFKTNQFKNDRIRTLNHLLTIYS